MNLSASYKPYLNRSGTGSPQYDTKVDILCYAEEDIKVIVDALGVDSVSTTQLYVDGTVPIKPFDAVTFSGVEKEVKRVNTFYREGVPDIRVVYL